jgi:hypothetical protein
MATTDGDLFREAIRTTLANRAGPGADARAIAGAMRSTWLQVAARLAPVIGTRGVDVLVSRSLHLTRTALPWPAGSAGHGDGAEPLAGFLAHLETSEAAAAATASHALLVNFTESLIALMGESLTRRLLDPVWESTAPAPGKERAP